MNRVQHFTVQLRDQRGALAVIIAIVLPLLIGFVALAVDVGYLMVTKNELQNIADAAALAGARRMGENYYVGLDPETDVTSVAQSIADVNKVALHNLAASNVDTKIGTWDPTKTPTSFDDALTNFPNAVQVKTNATINTLFGSILGVSNMNPETIACAALSGPCEGKPTIPLGIGKGWFDLHSGDPCGPLIRLNDTNDSCAGWTNLSTEKFKDKQVQDMLNGATTIPTVTAGHQVQFGGGTVTPTLQDLKTRFDIEKLIDDDGNPNTWTTYVVVYDAPCGKNPNKLYTVLGFAHIEISEVIATGGNKGIVAKVVCHKSEEKRGGCFNAGTLGAIPGLVR